ncbi:MAG: transcription elongation factor GreB, partial [Rhodoferax sp.]
SKAFTRDNDGADDEDLQLPPIPAGGKNYITPQGYAALRTELLTLIDEERPKVVEVVHWAASNGDRSENGDYIYGKKRLREIDRRIRFLTKRMEIAEIIDPSVHHGNAQIFFGASVTYIDALGAERSVTIKGIDEADSGRGEVSWVSPIARTLLKARQGDLLKLVLPERVDELEVLSVRYPEAPAA